MGKPDLITISRHLYTELRILSKKMQAYFLKVRPLEAHSSASQFLCFSLSKCSGKPYIKEQKHKYTFKMSAKPIIGLSLATTKLHNLYVLSAITPAKADFTLASLRDMGMESQNVSRVGGESQALETGFGRF